MRRILDAVMGVAEAMGGPGLFILAFLDSSFLSFPQVVDVLMIGLVARYPDRMLWYAALPTIGSVIGSYVIYELARRGGEAFLRKRLHERHVERAFELFRKYELFAVAIPALMPPPVPFKIFILAAGATGVRPRDFLIAISIGRGIRYFGEALLAAWYGQAALDFLREHGAVVAIVAVAAVVVLGAGWMWWSRRRQFDSTSGTSV